MCPQCGSTMILRSAKQGVTAGQKFWGCSRFPKCQGTKPYNQ
ncbi:MAG TPA: topoisomerase DNA-binding C4 zinc finger domain-containing protein [Alphaproteobacteria bacterium]|nr:topoisomerase DNA-binding C4 zinc finger domain-containing protein [Alphaproteobacteria bacterium]